MFGMVENWPCEIWRGAEMRDLLDSVSQENQELWEEVGRVHKDCDFRFGAVRYENDGLQAQLNANNVFL